MKESVERGTLKKKEKKKNYMTHEEDIEAKKELFGREVTCKVNAPAKLFNNKSTVALPRCIIYSTIKRLCFYTALTGKARHGQAEIN